MLKIYVGQIMIAIRVFACATVEVLLLVAFTGLRSRLGAVPDANLTAAELEEKIRLMLSYDENSDGVGTRAELKAGFRRKLPQLM